MVASTRALGLGSMDARVREAGPAALLADLDEALGRRPDDTHLLTLREAVALAAGALAVDRLQLPTQLAGRLPRGKTLMLDRLVADGPRDRAWLRPLAMSLTSPGGPLLRVLRGHCDFVCSVAVDPAGKRAATGSYGREVRVWDLSRGLEVARFTGERPGASYAEGAGGDAMAAVSFDGHEVVAVSADGCVYRFDAPHDARLDPQGRSAVPAGRTVLSGETDNLFAVALSGDGRRALAGPRDIWGWSDNLVKVWSTTDGRLLASIGDAGLSVQAAALSGDGTRAATSARDGTFVLWDVGTAAACARETSTPWSSLALSDDGLRLASGAPDGRVVVRRQAEDPASGRPLLGHTGTVHALTFVGPDRLVSVADDGAILWDAVTGQELWRQGGHGSPVLAVAATADTSRLVVGLADGSSRVWAPASPAAVSTYPELVHTGPVTRVSVADSGDTVVTLDAAGTVLWWDPRSGAPLGVSSADREGIAAGSDGDDAGATDRVAGRTPAPIALLDEARRLDAGVRPGDAGTSHTSTSVAVSADGRWALAASVDWTSVHYRLGIALEETWVRLWDLASGGVVRVVDEAKRQLVHGGHVDAFRCVAISADGTVGTVGGDDRTLRVWNLARGLLLASFTGESTITACALSPDGRLVVAGEATGRVHLLRLELPAPR